MKKIITVYTPTYNRAYCLHKLYESLLRQSNKTFKWLIIDDGSTDNTKEIVSDWINKSDIAIKYTHQENKGKQEAVNLAHSLIDTELNVCVDSDDYLTDNAIEVIINEWVNLKDKTNVAGIVGLDAYENGEIVGTSFPKNLKYARFCDFKDIHKIKGDKKFVYRTDVIQKFPPYPPIKGEKFPAPGYLYRLIDQQYTLALINDVLCIVTYMPDGISYNKFNQLKKNPNAFAFYRLERMRLAVNFKDYFTNTIHFVTVSIFAKRVRKGVNKHLLIILLSLFPGIMLYLYLKFTSRKGVIKLK